MALGKAKTKELNGLGSRVDSSWQPFGFKGSETRPGQLLVLFRQLEGLISTWEKVIMLVVSAGETEIRNTNSKMKELDLEGQQILERVAGQG